MRLVWSPYSVLTSEPCIFTRKHEKTRLVPRGALGKTKEKLRNNFK